MNTHSTALHVKVLDWQIELCWKDAHQSRWIASHGDVAHFRSRRGGRTWTNRVQLAGASEYEWGREECARLSSQLVIFPHAGRQSVGPSAYWSAGKRAAREEPVSWTRPARACKNIDHHADAEPQREREKEQKLYTLSALVCVWVRTQNCCRVAGWPPTTWNRRPQQRPDWFDRALLAFCACALNVFAHMPPRWWGAACLLDPAAPATFAIHFLFLSARPPLYVLDVLMGQSYEKKREFCSFATERGWRRMTHSSHFFSTPIEMKNPWWKIWFLHNFQEYRSTYLINSTMMNRIEEYFINSMYTYIREIINEDIFN